jgi:hypothetical protein
MMATGLMMRGSLLAVLIVGAGGAPSLLHGATASPTAAAGQPRATGQPAAAGKHPGSEPAGETAVTKKAAKATTAPERITLTRPTYVYALPDPKSRIIFIAPSGEKLVVVPSAVRSAPLRAPAASKECCRNGMYDPDLPVDIIDRVGEGYVPIFHTTLAAFGQGPDNTPPDRSASCKGDPSADGCRATAGLRDPSGLGSWTQVSTSDGRHRGWILVPHR